MQDGLCDGKGACELWPAQTVCKPSSCDPTKQAVTAASSCDGQGHCLTPAAQPCAPYLCQGASQCWQSCTAAQAATQCSPPNSCVGGSCGLKADGAACTKDAECQKGHCADGYCCNSACTGLCEACNFASTLGVCTPVRGAAAHGTCAGQGTACGSSCDGSNRVSCVYVPKGGGCSDGNACTYGDVCDGAGHCAGTQVTCPANSDCTVYACNGTSTCTKTFVDQGVECGACHCGFVQCDGMGSCVREGCLPPKIECGPEPLEPGAHSAIAPGRG